MQLALALSMAIFRKYSVANRDRLLKFFDDWGKRLREASRYHGKINHCRTAGSYGRHSCDETFLDFPDVVFGDHRNNLFADIREHQREGEKSAPAFIPSRSFHGRCVPRSDPFPFVRCSSRPNPSPNSLAI